MGDPQELPPQSSENKNLLPDVVHIQQIPALGTVVGDETETLEIDTTQNAGGDNDTNVALDEITETESISEHIPSKLDSITESDNVAKTHESQGLLQVNVDQGKSSLNVPYTHSPISDDPSTLEPSRQSTSWPLDVNAVSDIHLLSDESPVNLALSSDLSKEAGMQEKSLTPSINTPQSEHDTPKESRSDEYMDSLNEESSHKSNISIGGDSIEKSDNSLEKEDSNKSSGSEEIIKLDIRGQGVPKLPLSAAKIIFGLPPEGSTVIDSNIEPIPVFQNLLSPFLVGAGDGMKVEEIFCEMPSKDPSPSRSPELLSKDPSPERSLDSEKSLSSDKEQDVLVEEVTVDCTKEKDKVDHASILTQPKSIAPEDTMSFSTLTTDYKTICEEYHVKLVHLEEAITQRDDLIEELTVSLQRSVQERDHLNAENVQLTNEVQNLQHIITEHSHSDHDTIKAQLSDFIKYENMLKDDSTKFYSALMSGGSSVRSSNGEKDMDREEITVNYSRSDLKSSEDEFQTGFETKVTAIISKFDAHIEENLRNKLRESIIQVLCDEVGKMRIESDTELKELETQLQHDKQEYVVETRRLRELLASVKAGNADIDTLRQELSVKHEKEMENLRTYFEKKCSDMERSYSEEVWRGRACASPLGSASSLEAPNDAAGDYIRRRTRSAEFPSLTLEPTQLEQALKQASKKQEEMKAEHVAFVAELETRHRESIASLQEQIKQLKADIQTAENTETNVSVYPQDIDLELEKQQFEKRLEDVRQEVVQELQEQIQVLLSDPDAEVSSWPLELVALRDKIYGDPRTQEKESSDKTITNLAAAAVTMITLLISTGFFMWNAGDVTVEAANLPKAIFSSGWQHCQRGASMRIRPLLVIAMSMSQQPVELECLGIVRLSYSAYVSIVKSAYSAFSVLY